MSDILKEIDDAIEHLHKTPIEKVSFQALFSTLRESKNMITQFQDGLREILERNYQLTLSGYCPWCNTEEYPVDDSGRKISDTESVENAEQWVVQHDETCAVTMIEKLLRGEYIADEAV